MSDLLMFNSTIEHLDLRGNELGNDGAIILGRGIRWGLGFGVSAEGRPLVITRGYCGLRATCCCYCCCCPCCELMGPPDETHE
jgi:hypothetical protein